MIQYWRPRRIALLLPWIMTSASEGSFDEDLATLLRDSRIRWKAVRSRVKDDIPEPPRQPVSVSWRFSEQAGIIGDLW